MVPPHSKGDGKCQVHLPLADLDCSSGHRGLTDPPDPLGPATRNPSCKAFRPIRQRPVSDGRMEQRPSTAPESCGCTHGASLWIQPQSVTALLEASSLHGLVLATWVTFVLDGFGDVKKGNCLLPTQELDFEQLSESSV